MAKGHDHSVYIDGCMPPYASSPSLDEIAEELNECARGLGSNVLFGDARGPFLAILQRHFGGKA